MSDDRDISIMADFKLLNETLFRGQFNFDSKLSQLLALI